MTTDEMTPEATPQGMPTETPAAEAATAGAVALENSDARQSRRRKTMLLVALLVVVSLMSLVSGWYLLFRKPITALPLPGITQESLPHYSYSLYGVVKPMGVTTSASGDRIYVAETGGERNVRIYDGKGQPVGSFAPPKSTAASRVPVYLALDPLTGDVYVSDRLTASVYVCDKDGRYRRTFQPNPAIPGWQPLGLAFDPEGNLYVGDVGGPTHRVLEFARQGFTGALPAAVHIGRNRRKGGA